MPDYVQAIGRVLISAAFIVFGFLQFAHIGNYIANPAVIKVAGMTGGILSPTVIAYLVAAIDLFGGILILVGYQTRWTAIVLIVFVVLTLLLVHHFWTMEGPARAANQAHFYKNLGLIGGLLFLVALGSGRCSLDHRFSKKRG
jgi:putative oxidoreductase